MLKVIILIVSATFLVALNAHPFNPNESSESPGSSEVKETPNLQYESQQAKNESNDSAEAYVQESYIQILLPGIPLLNTTQLESLLNITNNLTKTETSEQTVSPLEKGPNDRDTRDVYKQDSNESSREITDSPSSEGTSENSNPSIRNPLQTGQNVRETRDVNKQDNKTSSEDITDSSSSEGTSENSKPSVRRPLMTGQSVRETRDVYKQDIKTSSEEKHASSSSKASPKNSKSSEMTPLQAGHSVRDTRDVYKQGSKDSSEEKKYSSSSDGSSENSKSAERTLLETGPNERETRDVYKQDSRTSSEETHGSSSSEAPSENSKSSERTPLQTGQSDTRDVYEQDGKISSEENSKPSANQAGSLNENVESPPAVSAQNHFQKTSNEKASYGSPGVTPNQPLLGRDAREVVDSVEERSQGSTEKGPVVFVTPQNTASTGFQRNLKEATQSSSSVSKGESTKISSTE